MRLAGALALVVALVTGLAAVVVAEPSGKDGLDTAKFEFALIGDLTDFLDVLEEETLRFAPRPVVLVHGDSHYFRIDKPLVARTSRRRVEHFTRVETFGNPNNHWLRAFVDPRDPNVFSFRQEIVEANVIDHTP